MTMGNPGSRTDHTLKRDALEIPGLKLHEQLRHGVDTLLNSGLRSAREEQTMEAFLQDHDVTLGWGLLKHVAETKTARATMAN